MTKDIDEFLTVGQGLEQHGDVEPRVQFDQAYPVAKN